MSNKFKYNVEYRRGDLHPETGKVFTPESYNEVAKRQAHNGWRVMSDSEVEMLTLLERKRGQILFLDISAIPKVVYEDIMLLYRRSGITKITKNINH